LKQLCECGPLDPLKSLVLPLRHQLVAYRQIVTHECVTHNFDILHGLAGADHRLHCVVLRILLDLLVQDLEGIKGVRGTLTPPMGLIRELFFSISHFAKRFKFISLNSNLIYLILMVAGC
jgi:hypothetical protein